MNQYLFQNCQKIVVFNKDLNEVLLAKRKGERDYEGVYSFIGGKMETTDQTLIEGMRREKTEEIGDQCKLLVYPNFNHMTLFKKADGNFMLLPHYLAIFESGDIILNEEYSDYKWVKIEDLEGFEPKIPNLPEIFTQLLKLKTLFKNTELVEI